MSRCSPLLWPVLLGFVLRCGVLIVRSDELRSDPDAYVAHAREVAEGRGFCGPYTHRPTAFRPPVFPMMLAAGMTVGLSESSSVAAANLLLGTATIWLIVLLARVMELSLRQQMLTAILVAADPLLLRYTAQPMTEVTSAFLLTLAMVFWVAAWRNPEDSALRSRGEFSEWLQRHRRTTFMLAGMTLGLLSLTRPIGLVVSALLLFATGLTVIRNALRTRGLLRSGIVPIGLVLWGLALIVGPWVFRNAVSLRHFIPATTHGGYTLALANNGAFYDWRESSEAGKQSGIGESTDLWQRGWEEAEFRRMRSDGVAPGDEVAEDRWWYDRAVATIRSRPGAFLAAGLNRLARFWALAPGETAFPGVVRTLMCVWYGGLWAGLVIRLWYARSGRRGSHEMSLWVCVIAFAAMHAVYWTNTRMRAPLMPLLCLLSVLGFTLLTETVNFRRRSAVSDSGRVA